MADPKFQIASADQRAYFPFNQEVVGLLEGMTAVELAQAVPYVKIWQIRPDDGRPVHAFSDGTPSAPLSLKLAEPPRFGSSANIQFRERPPVSLEQLSVKTDSSRGVATQKRVTLSFIVHRPDVIFGEEDPNTDNWTSIITPGLLHVIEYGWQSSGRNPLLRDGFDDTTGGKRIVIPSRKRIVVSFPTYDFSITADLQFRFTINGFENGDVYMRTATLAGLSHPIDERLADDQAQNQTSPSEKKVFPPTPVTLNDKETKAIFDELKSRLNSLEKDENTKTVTGIGKVVSFKAFADKFLAPTVDKILARMGFSKRNLWLGRFNKRAGTTVKKYGAKTFTDENSVGDFEFPLKVLVERFQELQKTGAAISVSNFVDYFSRLMAADNVWDRTTPKKDKSGFENQKVPDIRTKLVTSNDTADFYILDVKLEETQFTESDRQKGDEHLTFDQIKDKCEEKNVPFIQLLKANSFIKNADFNVALDEQMKAILIKRYMIPTREQITQEPDAERRKGTPAPSQLMYASAIQGTIEMIGNFAFDTFAMIWLDFGVRNWNGTFYVNEHEDIISRGNFVSRVSVIATGQDPLNTQGRHDQNTKSDAEEKPASGQSKKTGRSKRSTSSPTKKSS